MRQIYIVYTCYGMERVEKLFRSKIQKKVLKDENAKQLEIIYIYLQRVNNLCKMDANKLQADITSNMRGKEIEIVPQKMLNNSKVSYLVKFYNYIFPLEQSFLIKIYFRF